MDQNVDGTNLRSEKIFQMKRENFSLLGDDTVHVGIQVHDDMIQHMLVYRYTVTRYSTCWYRGTR
jgi:hypothetical protein